MESVSQQAARMVGINSLLMGFQYLALAGLVWWIAYRFARAKFWCRKIIEADPRRRQIQREIAFSLMSVVIFSVGLMVSWGFSRQGWNRFYWGFQSRDWVWIPVSTVLTIVLWDTWFYWTHRAMHHRCLFRWFHRTHHLSHNPTPWTSYAVDPLEATVYGTFIIAVSFLYPLHPVAVGIFMTFQFLWNLGIHSGFEFMPAWFPRSLAGWWISSPTSHVQHHETGRGNFGFCFQFWDRLMGTCHPDYDRRLQSVVDRARSAA